MPNWVDNLIVIRGRKDSIDELVSSVATPENALDFETILPTPAVVSKSPHYNEVNHDNSIFNDKKASRLPWLATLLSGSEEEQKEEYIAYVKHVRPDIDVEDIKNEFTRLLGANRRYWYSFNNKVWNTKWGSCDTVATRVNDNELRYDFLTAWDRPKAVADKLAYFFPELEMTHTYLEEGNNLNGAAIYKNGRTVDEFDIGRYYDDGSDTDADTVQEL